MGPKVGVTLLTVGSTTVNEPAITMAILESMATLEPMVREKSLDPLVTKLVVSQTNWRPGMQPVLTGMQVTPPNVRVEF